MAMQLTIPNDLEALVQKRLATGDFASAEEVLRSALEAQDDEETWTDAERSALDEKIEHALEQVAAGHVFGSDAARRKLAALREAHLANPSR